LSPSNTKTKVSDFYKTHSRYFYQAEVPDVAAISQKPGENQEKKSGNLKFVLASTIRRRWPRTITSGLVNIYDSEKAFGANLFCLLAKTTPTLSKDTYIRHYLLNEEQQGQPQNIEKSALLTSSTATIPHPDSFSKPPTSNNPSSNSSINSKASLLPNFLSKTSLDVAGALRSS